MRLLESPLEEKKGEVAKKLRYQEQEECEAGASSKASPPGELDGKE